MTVRAPSVEGRTVPHGYECWDDYMQDVERAARREWTVRDRTESLAIGKAMRLAPTVAVFCALVDGQPVPTSALDAGWRARYGL